MGFCLPSRFDLWVYGLARDKIVGLVLYYFGFLIACILVLAVVCYIYGSRAFVVFEFDWVFYDVLVLIDLGKFGGSLGVLRYSDVDFGFLGFVLVRVFWVV